MDYSNLNLDQFLRPLDSPLSRITSNAYNFDTATERASITNSTLQDQSVTNAKIVNLTADKITAGTISSGVVYGGTISGTQITAGTIQANVGYLGTLSASQLTAGSINAANITVFNIDADRINTGEIDANVVRIDNLEGVTNSVGSTVINGGYITTGTIDANLIRSGTLVGRNVQSSSGDNRIILNNGDYVDFYVNNTLRGRFRGASNVAGGIRAIDTDFVLDNNHALLIEGDTAGDFFRLGVDDTGTYGDTVMVLTESNRFFLKNSAETTNLFTVSSNQTFSANKILVNNNEVSEVSWIGESSSKRIQFDQSGRIQINDDFDPSTSSAYNLGGNDRYWQDVHCESVVDHSMGLYDTGFVDEAGNRISDIEAILKIKAHPTRVMTNGRPYLDKRTFPKEFFLPAKNTDTGEFYPRDEDDRPYREKDGKKEYLDSYDGVSLTQTVALLIGSIKELAAERDELVNNQNALLDITYEAVNRLINLEERMSKLENTSVE